MCWLSFLCDPDIFKFDSTQKLHYQPTSTVVFSFLLFLINLHNAFSGRMVTEMVTLTETNKNPFIGGRYGQERQGFFKSGFEHIPYFLSCLIDVHVETK